MISTENYEIWMIDYLDGNLSEEDQVRLFQFLAENPHLNEELKGLDNLVLNPVDEVYKPKYNLLKVPEEYAGMAYSDYIATKEVEEGLDANEQHWKASYLKEDASHSKLFVLYSKVFLRGNKAIQYPFKRRLKRFVFIPGIRLSTIQNVSAAALIGILLSLGITTINRTPSAIQTVVVNDTPSLITMPKIKDAKVSVKDAVDMPVTLSVQNSSASINRQVLQPSVNKLPEPIDVQPLSGKGVRRFKTQQVNAYELGLNVMMPIVIANNLDEKKQNYIAAQSQVKAESQRLSISSRAIVGGVRVINFLSGNETEMKRVLDQDGQMVAYQVVSDNISIRQKIKNKPVTN